MVEFRTDISADIMAAAKVERLERTVMKAIGDSLLDEIKERAPIGDYHHDPYVYHGYASGPRLKESLKISTGVSHLSIEGIDYTRFVVQNVNVLRTYRALRWWAGFLKRYPNFSRKTPGPPRTYLRDPFLDDAVRDFIRSGEVGDIVSSAIQWKYGGTSTARRRRRRRREYVPSFTREDIRAWLRRHK